VVSFSYWSIKPLFHIEGKLTDVLLIPSSWGFPTSPVRHQRLFLAPLPGIEGEEAPTSTTRHQTCFLAPLPGRKRISARGVSHFQSFYLFIILLGFFTFFLLLVYQKYKKISFFYSCYFLFICFSFARMSTPENTKLCDFTSTNNNDFICTPIAPPAPEANFYEIKPALLNLVTKEQFFGVSTNDAAAHLNIFFELCEMQNYKDVDGDIIKLKLFSFSLRGRAKDWLLSLPRNSIDPWVKCKDAFIGKYYPPAKIISLRSDIMKFKQFDNEIFVGFP
jgi:hypothetical protein